MNVPLFLCSFLVVCRSREVQLTPMCLFVKQCIRNYINEKSECPSCRKTANEGHLRVNPVMEEAVSAWKLARCTMHFIVVFHLYLIPRNRTYMHIDHSSCNFPKMNNPVSHTHKQTKNENAISPVIVVVIESWNPYRARRMRSNVQLGQVQIRSYHRRRREKAELKTGLMMISYQVKMEERMEVNIEKMRICAL